jgi:hypothetical protein
MKKIVFFICLLSTIGFSQTFRATNYGFTTGLLLNFGTHVNAIGINLKAYYQDYFYQFNGGTSFCWNINSYGGRKRFWESRNTVGIVLLGGKKTNTVDFQLDGLNHQTTYNTGIGYNYLWYFDNVHTSQRSGGWALHLKNWSFYMENDVFGGQAKDRFRSGHFAVSHRTGDFKISSGFYIWTGETDSSSWQRGATDACPYGYKLLDDAPYGTTSHGILYGSLLYNASYGQNLVIRAGIDDENLRNFIQNKLIHDLIWLPKTIERKTPNYPRLNKYGCPVFNKEEARPAKFHFQIGTSENWSN